MQTRASAGFSRITPGAAILAATAVAVFWRTAYPTITWWDSAGYSLAAGTLGITGPPGSLLLTLLGWPIAHLPLGTSPAHLLNLFAGVLAGLATTLIYVIARRLLRAGAGAGTGSGSSGAAAFGAALGALTFAFSTTLWEHAIKFTPYVLTAVFTGLILWTMVRWWDEADRPDSWRRLAMLGLLFGLDFSVHRTNSLLIPAALAWILVRRPRALLHPQSVGAGTGAFLAGLAVNLLLIPMAVVTRSTLNFTDPSNWSRYWDYVSLKMLGGGFLLDVLHRKSNIWTVQAADLVRVLGDNFLHAKGPLGLLGALPALAAVLGLVMLLRNSRRLGIAFTLVLFIQASLTVLYFNIPADFFRPFDRHYLPICVTIGVLVACGLASMMRAVANLAATRSRAGAGAVAVLAVIVPVAQLAGNWPAHDASQRWFARDYATNALGNLPPNAIYFTVGDNDTFPVMYLRDVEGVRRDVTIINLSIASLPDYAAQLTRRDPTFPLSMTTGERAAWNARTKTDTTFVIPVSGTAGHLGLAGGAVVPDNIAVQVKPMYGSKMQYSDITLLDILRTNHWRRPITFAITVGSGMGWLEPYGRLDGIFWRVVPVRNPSASPGLLRANLIGATEYRGYADRAIHLDDVSRTMAFQYYAAFKKLLEAERESGEVDRCRTDAKAILAVLPGARLDAPVGYLEQLESACGDLQRH